MKYYIFIITTLALVISGCAGVPVHTQILKSKHHVWQIEMVNSFEIDGVVTVSGHLKKTKSYSSRKGHIDIIVRSPNRDVFLQTTASLGLRAMRKGGDHFNVDILKALPENAIIEVAYHDDIASSNHQSL